MVLIMALRCFVSLRQENKKWTGSPKRTEYFYKAFMPKLTVEVTKIRQINLSISWEAV